MTPARPATQAAPGIDDCWNRIGIRGDRSCGELAHHAHCMHCGVYADAAGSLLQRPVPAQYQHDWARHFAREAPAVPDRQESALVFRIGDEWLALPAKLAVTVAEMAQPHRIPHRGGRGLLGIVNVGGALYPCVSLPALLEIGAPESQPPQVDAAHGRRSYARLLVAQFDAHAYALPVEDVHGIHRYAAAELQAPPTTAGRKTQAWLRGALLLDAGRAGPLHVGCIDADLLRSMLAELLK
jgi:chemotaxis-related protein WspD